MDGWADGRTVPRLKSTLYARSLKFGGPGRGRSVMAGAKVNEKKKKAKQAYTHTVPIELPGVRVCAATVVEITLAYVFIEQVSRDLEVVVQRQLLL